MSYRPDIRARWKQQARTASTSPFYEYLASKIAEDREVAAILEAAPPSQRLGVLVLAAVQYLLLTGTQHPLAGYYPSLGGTSEGDPYPVFRDFCLAHRAELERICSTRSVQTNEVRRSAYLMPAIARAGAPHLVEAGASAGLNLIFDRYFFDYGSHGSSGDPSSPVRIAPEVRGEFRAPSMPAPESRLGIDPHPLDVADDDTVTWLRACIWPEHHERRALLDAAVAVARGDPPRLVAANAATDLSRIVSDLPAGPVCVVHSVVMPYLSLEQRKAFRAQLDEIAGARDLSVVSGEGAGAIKDVFGADLAEAEGFWVALTRWRDGAPVVEPLGRAGWHGEWMEWIA
jgi:hypothetical protein